MKSAGRPMKRRLIGSDGPSDRGPARSRRSRSPCSRMSTTAPARCSTWPPSPEQLHDAGALVVWDLCHSIGVVEIAFDLQRGRFRGRVHLQISQRRPRVAGVYRRCKGPSGRRTESLIRLVGHAAPFAFDRDFRPDPGIKRFLCGTQPIISLRGVDVALDAMDGVEVAALRQKSLALTELFMARVAALLPSLRDRDAARSLRCAAARSGSPSTRAMRSSRR